VAQVTVTTEDLKAGRVILLEENIELVHLESALASRQLLERVRWALADADALARRAQRVPAT
jgi:hypothetical protein